MSPMQYVAAVVLVWIGFLGQAASFNLAKPASEWTPRIIRRAPLSAKTARTAAVTVLSNSTTFAKTFDGAVLYQDSYDVDAADGNGTITESIQVTCTTCYINGTASVNITTDGTFNLTQALDSVAQEVGTVVKNLTDAAVSDIINDTKSEIESLFKGHVDLDELDFPTLQYNFSVDVAAIPQCHVRFQFDDLELYMNLDTALSAGGTYILNLYTSESGIGVEIGDKLQLGVVFSVDLILDVEAEIDISSGFHLKLGDGAAVEINMFDTQVSTVSMNGGSFEFLPVTLTNATSSFTAILRLGLHAGIELSTPDISIADIDIGHFSTGLEVGVFADLAEFTTSFNESLPSENDEACVLAAMEQAYVFALGADAGATLAIGHHTWGPDPTTTIPLFYTTLSDACASSATSPSRVAGRDATGDVPVGMTATTLTTSAIYTAIQCPKGKVLCPVSLQTTSLATQTITLATAVPSGSSATFPTTIGSSLTSAIAFGTDARSLISSSGTPVSYVPPPPPPPTSAATSAGGSAGSGGLFGPSGGLTSEDDKIIIGVSVGVGVPLLLAAATVMFIYGRRRMRKGSWASSQVAPVSQPLVYPAEPEPRVRASVKKPALVAVASHSSSHG